MPRRERERVVTKSLFCHHYTDLKKDLSQLSIEIGKEEMREPSPNPSHRFTLVQQIQIFPGDFSRNE